MESIITIVGFLGAGKTTLLKKLITNYIEDEWKPFVILNDYENAYMDAQQFYEEIDNQYVQALSGSCICCSGINELREFVNTIATRIIELTPKGIIDRGMTYDEYMNSDEVSKRREECYS